LIGIWCAIQASEILGWTRQSSWSAAVATFVLFGHGGGRQHAVGTDEIATLSDGLARKSIASSDAGALRPIRVLP
jgi:hypothetical protein